MMCKHPGGAAHGGPPMGYCLEHQGRWVRGLPMDWCRHPSTRKDVAPDLRWVRICLTCGETVETFGSPRDDTIPPPELRRSTDGDW